MIWQQLEEKRETQIPVIFYENNMKHNKSVYIVWADSVIFLDFGAHWCMVKFKVSFLRLVCSAAMGYKQLKLAPSLY